AFGEAVVGGRAERQREVLAQRDRGVLARGAPGAHFANTCARSPNALNSSALPEGSRKNIVACSPTWPLKRTCGSITNFLPAPWRFSANDSQSFMGRVAPKWRTGTSSPSTALVFR